MTEAVERGALVGGRPDERPLPQVLSLSFSGVGVVVAALFFALSLLDSLLPRPALMQGVVSGISAAIGYGVGTGGHWLWRYLQIPSPRGRARDVTRWAAVAAVAVAFATAVWQHVGWQNSVREIFSMDPVSPTIWPVIIVVTVLIAALIMVISRALWKLLAFAAATLSRLVSPRFARVLGTIAVLVFLSLLYNGVLVNAFFGVANQIFSTRDTITVEGVTQPTSPNRSGSPESMASWETLGRQGRSFVGTGPTIDELNSFSGGGAQEPIRVYAGLTSADTLEDRADLVLAELQRTGAFDRSVLVVATTTGTGFLDRRAVDPLEYLHNGDTAIVGVQYSFLPSWISLLADQEAVRETSQVVFETIHAHWSELPETERPELYLYGLSLGSFGVESILSSVGIINSPISGAFMSGPPFLNPLHQQIVNGRDEGSPSWEPVYGKGRTVRFTTQDNALGAPNGAWGPTRIAYLQYGSDPIVFFAENLAFSVPEWLKGERAPDVSKDMVWIPLVTMAQVAMDLPAAASVPPGFGHLYSYESNIDSWAGVTALDDWSDEDTQRLVAHLEATVGD